MQVCGALFLACYERASKMLELHQILISQSSQRVVDIVVNKNRMSFTSSESMPSRAVASLTSLDTLPKLKVTVESEEVEGREI